MKEFDLELAKAGHPVCTRDGKPVRIVCFDAKGNYPILALEDNNDEEIPRNYTNEGFYYNTERSSNDLMMVSEVKESDIKEAIKYAITASTHEDGILLNGVTESEAIAWLEEQGEQTPADKTEPKFKVGDWIIHNKNIEFANSLMLVTGKDNNKYLCKEIGGQCSYNIEFIDRDYHLWTIADAKDGDILVDEYNNIGLYKEEKGSFWDSYIYLGWDKRLYGFGGYHNLKNTKPATKEQCDLLFQKMHEAGYEWNAKKKELKKIGQNPAWSEEDEKMIEHCIDIFEKILKSPYVYAYTEDCLSWLKSIKERYTWKKSLATADLENSLCDIQDGYSDTSYEYRILGEAIEFIRCTEPQPNWKPTEEQIQALEYQVHSTYEGSWQYAASKELLEQLKKL